MSRRTPVSLLMLLAIGIAACAPEDPVPTQTTQFAPTDGYVIVSAVAPPQWLAANKLHLTIGNLTTALPCRIRLRDSNEFALETLALSEAATPMQLSFDGHPCGLSVSGGRRVNVRTNTGGKQAIFTRNKTTYVVSMCLIVPEELGRDEYERLKPTDIEALFNQAPEFDISSLKPRATAETSEIHVRQVIHVVAPEEWKKQNAPMLTIGSSSAQLPVLLSPSSIEFIGTTPLAGHLLDLSDADTVMPFTVDKLECRIRLADGRRASVRLKSEIDLRHVLHDGRTYLIIPVQLIPASLTDEQVKALTPNLSTLLNETHAMQPFKLPPGPAK